MRAKAKHFSEAVRGFARANETMNRRIMAEQINERFGTDYTFEHIKSLCTRMGLKTGRTGQFYPGQPQIPNSGCKSANRTSFKKGSKPHNTRPLGHVRCHEGYWQIKVFDTGVSRHDFVLCHHLVWILHYGPVPKGKIIIFVDGDTSNIEPENLRCITRGAHVIINKRQYRNLPAEAIHAGITLGELIDKTNMRSRA